MLMLLTEAFPSRLDLNALMLLDHGLLHSADLGGPESLHPAIPIRAGELGIKRKSIEKGLDVMIRAGLADIVVSESGLLFVANDRANGFVNLLTSSYSNTLLSRASWVVANFDDLTAPTLRSAMQGVLEHWSEEFEPLDAAAGED